MSACQNLGQFPPASFHCPVKLFRFFRDFLLIPACSQPEAAIEPRRTFMSQNVPKREDSLAFQKEECGAGKQFLYFAGRNRGKKG